MKCRRRKLLRDALCAGDSVSEPNPDVEYNETESIRKIKGERKKERNRAEK